MLFNSLHFIFLFLPLCFISCLLFKKHYLNVLLLFSLFFYGYWDYRYVGLILLSIVTNYLFLNHPRLEHNKTILRLNLAFNLGLLCYFKYLNFFLSNVSDLAGFDWVALRIILPLGISFYTFQQISCVYDNYKKKSFNYSFQEYALFVLFFPHLIAGPLLYYKEIIPQFHANSVFEFNPKNFISGIYLFSIGLGKKVIFADTLSHWANDIFNNATSLGMIPTFDAWLGSLSYTFQLYFDFSGYADMAIGCGLIFNFRMPINFNSPYKSTSLIEFWRRWHITLSTFLKDHIYIPLGGNKDSNSRRYFNIFTTMLVGGFWHGAGWPFILWGILHGVFICFNHFIRDMKVFSIKLPKWIGILFTFNLINVLWVFFRAENVTTALNLLQRMFWFYGDLVFTDYRAYALIFIILSMLICFSCKNSTEILTDLKEEKSNEEPITRSHAFTLGAVFVTSVLILGIQMITPNFKPEFIYFQF